MIVDLLRNDLSRVCSPHSVDVPVLCSGELARDHDAVSLLRACFPGSSIARAPKVRSMQLITEIERVARGIYCGAIAIHWFRWLDGQARPWKTAPRIASQRRTVQRLVKNWRSKAARQLITAQRSHYRSKLRAFVFNPDRFFRRSTASRSLATALWRARFAERLAPTRGSRSRKTPGCASVTLSSEAIWGSVFHVARHSRTILSFSSSDQRRRGPVSTTSSRSTWALRLSVSIRTVLNNTPHRQGGILISSWFVRG